MTTARTFDEVVDFVLAKAPPEHQDREFLAQQISFLVKMGDQLKAQLEDAGPQILQLIDGLQVPDGEKAAIEAKYKEYEVSTAKLARMLGITTVENVIALSYVTVQQDPGESYERQALKMFILGNLRDDFDVLKD